MELIPEYLETSNVFYFTYKILIIEDIKIFIVCSVCLRNIWTIILF